MEIAGSTALVTGASRRIGRALALALAQSGCNVAIHYRSDAAAALETREQARDFGVDCEVVQADLALAEECGRLWFATVEKMGDVPNIIINNASHFDRTDLPSLTSQDFDLAMSVNVRAPLLLAQAMQRDLDGNGKILNINDRRRAYRSRIAYSISNAALTGLIKTLALSMAPQIQVNEIRLGVILPLSDDESESPSSTSDATLGPAGRPGTLDEVCDAALSIIGNDYINGASLTLDGGLSAVG